MTLHTVRACAPSRPSQTLPSRPRRARRPCCRFTGRGGCKGLSPQSALEGPGVTRNIPVSPETLARGSTMIPTLRLGK